MNVGDGVSILWGLSLYPATVIAVKNAGKRVHVRRDGVIISGKFYDPAVGAIQVFTLRADGSYRLMGDGSPKLLPGRRFRKVEP